jgi:hypothetical protein
MATIIDKIKEWKSEKSNEMQMGQVMMLQKQYETATDPKKKEWAAARLRKMGFGLPEDDPLDSDSD